MNQFEATITYLANELQEYKTSGCSHPFHGNGYSVPSNEEWPLVECINEDAIIPGGSITEDHWKKDLLFEERLMNYYSKMGDSRFVEHTMEGYLKEYRDACNGIRTNNKHHLERIFRKAYDEVYAGNAWDQQDDKLEQDKMLKTILAADGVLRG